MLSLQQQTDKENDPALPAPPPDAADDDVFRPPALRFDVAASCGGRGRRLPLVDIFQYRQQVAIGFTEGDHKPDGRCKRVSVPRRR